VHHNRVQHRSRREKRRLILVAEVIELTGEVVVLDRADRDDAARWENGLERTAVWMFTVVRPVCAATRQSP
jgi:hypothetical protein